VSAIALKLRSKHAVVTTQLVVVSNLIVIPFPYKFDKFNGVTRRTKKASDFANAVYFPNSN